MKSKVKLRSFQSLMKSDIKCEPIVIDKSGNNEIKTLTVTTKRPKFNNGF